MDYEEMIAKALKGRSVNSMAKAWGIPQTRLDRYVKGIHMPDYTTGLKLAKEAGISPGEAFEILANEEQNHKAKNFKLQMGFACTSFMAALAGLAMLVTLFLTPAKAEARTYAPTFKQESSCLYIMSNVELILVQVKAIKYDQKLSA